MQNQPDTEQPYPAQPEPVLWTSFFARHKVLTVFLTSLALTVVVSVVVPTLGGSDTPAGTADAAGTGDAPAPRRDRPGSTDGREGLPRARREGRRLAPRGAGDGLRRHGVEPVTRTVRRQMPSAAATSWRTWSRRVRAKARAAVRSS
jgi:hypothetical protein